MSKKLQSYIVAGIITALCMMGACNHAFANPNPSKPSGVKPSSERKKNAKELIENARKATALTIKHCKASPKLKPNEAAAKPFLQTLQKLMKSLDAAQSALAKKDKAFLKAIREAYEASLQLPITWRLTKVNDANVEAASKKAVSTIELLYKAYGPTAARKKKGGELTAKEKKEFEKLVADQSALQSKIKAMRAKAGSDKALLAALNDIEARSNAIRNASYTLDGWLVALAAVDTLASLFDAYSYFWGPAWSSDWVYFVNLGNGWGSATYEIIDVEVTIDWSYTEVSVEYTEDISVEIEASEVEASEEYIEEVEFESEEKEVEEGVEEEADESAEEASDETQGEETEGGEEEEGEGEQEEESAEDDGGDDNVDDGGDEGGDDEGDE